jgi:hypothetical protein
MRGGQGPYNPADLKVIAELREHLKVGEAKIQLSRPSYRSQRPPTHIPLATEERLSSFIMYPGPEPVSAIKLPPYLFYELKGI